MEARYSRNRIYLSKEDQVLIKQRRVLLAGAGIGSIIAECILRLGFEQLTVIDGDTVEESNLNRQNYEVSDIGRPKVEALRDRLLRINPKAKIETAHVYINESNLQSIVEGHDMAINALDFKSNIPFQFDEVCIERGIPILHPYNIGWAAAVFVINHPEKTMRNIIGETVGFEKAVAAFVSDRCKEKCLPNLWIDKTIEAYEREGNALPPPQLPVASWLAGGMCASILYNIATGIPVKTYPQFYFYSTVNDRC